MKDETRVNHLPPIHLPRGNEPLVSPIYQSVKFTAERVADVSGLLRRDGGGYFYSRVSNPTVRQLELLLAGLQGRDDALAVGSGVAALSSCLLSVLRPGDHVVMFVESYKPTRYLVRSLLGKFGVRSSLLSLGDYEALGAEVKAQGTRVILFESPTNPMLRIADIGRITALAGEHGALTLLDNTFAGFHNHGGFPVDIYVHSLTKFASGHGDVMGGVIIARRELIDAMHADVYNIGATLDPHAAYLILRGMKTYFLRYRRQCETALAVARWLDGHPLTERLRYPGLPSHPEHELGRRQMADSGGIIAFDIRGEGDKVPALIDHLQLFRLAGSLGSTESLVAPVMMSFGGDLDAAQLSAAGMSRNSIRLSVGLEDPGDLVADLDQALARC